MIVSFRCTETQKLFNGIVSRKFQAIERIAVRKLAHLDQAATIADLAGIPGNRLESLHGDRKGQYSIRINDQFRICFVWHEPDASDVEIADYH